MAERLKAPVLKTGEGESPSWVRIPLCPPCLLMILGCLFLWHKKSLRLLWQEEIALEFLVNLCKIWEGGLSLIGNKVNQLKSSNLVNRIVLGSDSDEMLEEGKKFGAEPIKRADFFCDETKADAKDMIHNMCSLIETDVIVWAHCTNPFISSKTYDEAIKIFLNNQTRQEKYDSLLSVVKLQNHIWDENKRPLNYDPYKEKHTLAKDLPIYYVQDGGIFIQTHKQMLANSYFFGKRPYLFCIPEEEFLDINNMHDLNIARAIVKERGI